MSGRSEATDHVSRGQSYFFVPSINISDSSQQPKIKKCVN